MSRNFYKSFRSGAVPRDLLKKIMDEFEAIKDISMVLRDLNDKKYPSEYPMPKAWHKQVDLIIGIEVSIFYLYLLLDEHMDDAKDPAGMYEKAMEHFHIILSCVNKIDMNGYTGYGDVIMRHCRNVLKLNPMKNAEDLYYQRHKREV